MLAFIKSELNRDAALRVAKGLGACAVGVAIAALFAQTTLFDRLSSWLYDSLQRSTGRTIDLDNVLVLDVDEESLRRMAQPMGQWRTDREVYAGVVRYLEAHGARAIAFHLLIADERPGDEALAAALGRNTALAAAGRHRPISGSSPNRRTRATRPGPARRGAPTSSAFRTRAGRTCDCLPRRSPPGGGPASASST